MKEKGTGAHSIVLNDKRIKYQAGKSKGKTSCLPKKLSANTLISEETAEWEGRKQASNC